MDPAKLKETLPKRFHRKESLFPSSLPHLSLQELLTRIEPGEYTTMPSKGRGHKGTAVRVWRRHVNVADRLRRRREIKALWRVGVRDVLGDQAKDFDFVLHEHEAYMIYYCVRARSTKASRRVPAWVPQWWAHMDDASKTFVEHARDGWCPSLDFSAL